MLHRENRCNKLPALINGIKIFEHYVSFNEILLLKNILKYD